jgi:methionyl-tRNA formyltransferase
LYFPYHLYKIFLILAQCKAENSMKIVFMGSGNFGIPALQKAMAGGHTVSAIVTTPPKPQGRGLHTVESEVSTWAKSQGIGPIINPKSLLEQSFIQELTDINADVFFVVSFRILPPQVYALPRFGAVNLHASLLPQYRGPAPIQRAIEAGETKTGVTVFRIDRGIDTGAILLQKSVEIGPSETTPQLHDRLALVGAEALVEALDLIGKEAFPLIAQDETKASRAPKLAKEEGRLNFSENCRQLYNRIRAFKPFPGTYALLDGHRLGIEWAEPVETSISQPPGAICSVTKDCFEVACGQGRLRVLEVKPEGRRHMPSAAFLRGTPVTSGTLLK